MTKVQRALVTGATGFIGSRLTQSLLADDIEVAIVARASSSLDQLGEAANKPELLRHDGTTGQLREFITKFSPEIVFHLAANYVGTHGSDDIAPLVADNVTFTAQVCDAMVAAECPYLVSAGTVWQHAKSLPSDPIPTPNSLYAATKQAAEDIIGYYAQTGALSSITLKIYDSYGPGDPRPKFLNALAAAAAAGTTLDASTGEQQMHLVHIDDIVAALRLSGDRLTSGKSKEHQSYTLPSAKSVNLKSIVNAWQTATGRTVNVAWGARAERPGEVMVPWEGPRLPGWKPKISLKTALKEIFAA